VQWHGEEYGHHNLWGALNSMEELWDDLDNMERAAYKQVKRELENAVVESEGGQID
jgi:hypothetical protein